MTNASMTISMMTGSNERSISTVLLFILILTSPYKKRFRNIVATWVLLKTGLVLPSLL
jgi:hypothetical protein